MATEGINPQNMTEDELRAAYEQEIKRVRVEHIVLENIVTLVNLGMRRTGLMAGTEDEKDLGQVQLAIESVSALLPQIDTAAPEQAAPIREALSQLQMAYVQASTEAQASGSGPDGSAGGQGGAASSPSTQTPQAGPAQQSGRLWVPGQ